MEGEDRMVDDRQALCLSMILHELATNAVKYGALSPSRGRVRVATTPNDGAMNFSWIEIDGPKVAPPAERGFGTTLIERICSFELNGSAKLDFAESGLACRISFPLNEGRIGEAPKTTATGMTR
jgi:two-component sensor histidine kinase